MVERISKRIVKPRIAEGRTIMKKTDVRTHFRGKSNILTREKTGRRKAGRGQEAASKKYEIREVARKRQSTSADKVDKGSEGAKRAKARGRDKESDRGMGVTQGWLAKENN